MTAVATRNPQSNTPNGKQRCQGTKANGEPCMQQQAGEFCRHHKADVVELQADRKQLFIIALRDDSHGTVSRARMAAGGVDRSTLYKWRGQDAEFAAAWDEAVDDDTDEIEAAMSERAKGWKDPVRDASGNVVGFRWKYSDKAAEIMLKARRPDVYRERVDVRHGLERGGSELPVRQLVSDPAALEVLAGVLDDIEIVDAEIVEED